MPLPSSGAISLNDMHIEVGGSSGTQVSINDSDIRGLIGKSSGAQMSFSEWYGASAVGTMPAYGRTETLGHTGYFATQQIDSGYGANVLNIYYKRSVIGYTITQAELEEAGIYTGMRLTGISWYMMNAPLYQPLPNHQIALCNMPGSSTNLTNPTISSNRTTFLNVVNQTNWSPGTSVNQYVGRDFNTYFNYTGGAIGVIVAWGAVSPNYHASGITGGTDTGTTYYTRTDAAGTYSTSDTANTATNSSVTRSGVRPRTRFRVNVYDEVYMTRYTTSQLTPGQSGQVGISISKDMSSSMGTHSFQYHPVATGNKTGYYFGDWGNDIFDSWGYFHLAVYHNGSYNNFIPIDFSSGRNGADGSFTESEFTDSATGSEWYLKHGFPLQGAWMFHIRCKKHPTSGSSPNATNFYCIAGGNMGSDSSTYNRVNYYDKTLSSGQAMRLYIVENADNSSYVTNEKLTIHIMGLKKTQMGASTGGQQWTYKQQMGNDNLYIWSAQTNGGLTWYMFKGDPGPPYPTPTNMMNWLANDLERKE